MNTTRKRGRARSEESGSSATWAEIFEEVARRGEVVLRRGDRLYTLRQLGDGSSRSRRREAIRVPASEGRSARSFADSPVVRGGFAWQWDPQGGGLRLVKAAARARR